MGKSNRPKQTTRYAWAVHSFACCEEIETLNEEDAKLLVTDIKGKPIKDMPSTRGEMFVLRFHQVDCN